MGILNFFKKENSTEMKSNKVSDVPKTVKNEEVPGAIRNNSNLTTPTNADKTAKKEEPKVINHQPVSNETKSSVDSTNEVLPVKKVDTPREGEVAKKATSTQNEELELTDFELETISTISSSIPKKENPHCGSIEDSIPQRKGLFSKKGKGGFGTNSGTNYGRNSGAYPYVEPYQYKPRKRSVKEKLMIVLIENTIKAREEISMMQRILRKLPTTGKVCVISYNDKVKTSACIKLFNFEIDNMLVKDEPSNETCWYDALMAAAEVITANYLKKEETEFEITEINSIEVVGVGSCTDTCSITERKVAIEKFSKALKAAKIAGKYFCFSDENTVEAAAAGFRSIGFDPKK